jgi:hypothetical protein
LDVKPHCECLHDRKNKNDAELGPVLEGSDAIPNRSFDLRKLRYNGALLAAE